METNVFVGCVLVDMYASCGALAKAREVFDKLVVRNVVSWNALISGYTEHDHNEESLSAFEEMKQAGIPPDAVTLVSILKACGGIVSITKGEEIFTEIIIKGFFECGFYLCTSLVSMYVKCGDLGTARFVLEKLPVRNSIVWNALISGYADQDCSQAVLDCLKQMLHEGFSPDDVTFVCSLKACGSLLNVSTGQELHDDVVLRGMEMDLLIGSSLVDMYTKCGLVVEGQKVFDNLQHKDEVSWTVMIAGYVQHGDSEAAIQCFTQMQLDEALSPGALTLSCGLKACSSHRAKDKGQELHTEVIKKGAETELLVGRNLVDFYCNCGLLVEAFDALHKLPVHDTVSWSIIILGYLEQESGLEALNAFKQMQQKCVDLDVVGLVCGLKACGGTGATSDGQEIHSYLCKKGSERHPFVGSTLTDMYAKCALFMEARTTMDKTVASWNAIIAGYVEYGCAEEGRDSFEKMQEEGFLPDTVTFVCYLKACCNLGAMSYGQEIHAQIVQYGLEMDILITTTLIDMYAKCDLVADAQYLLDKSSFQSVALWTAFMAGCVEHGHGEEALRCIENMQYQQLSPSAVTFSCLIRACGSVGAMNKGQEMYMEVVKRGMHDDAKVSLGSTMIDMYAKCGLLAKAQETFDKLPLQDAVSWISLLAGYAEHGTAEEALNFLDKMEHDRFSPLSALYVNSLKVCGRAKALTKGHELHSEIVRRGLEGELCIGNMLVAMYAKCEAFAEARQLSSDLPEQADVSQTALMKAYLEIGNDQYTLDCFDHMEQDGGTLQSDTALIGILKASATLGATERGRVTHSDIIRKGLEENPLLGNLLVAMYAKCGLLVEAEKVFNKLLIHDVASWTALIHGCSQLGNSKAVIRICDKMVEEAVEPDAVAFLGVLNVFSHAGLVDEGKLYFGAAVIFDGPMLCLEHYTCLVDLLSRSGLIRKALEFIEKVPLQPGIVMWLTVLGACRKLGQKNIGSYAFEHALSLDLCDPTSYVSMCNIYSDAATEEESAEICNTT